MKKSLLFISLLLSAAGAFAQTGYNIDITLRPFKNQKIYLGYYYGKMKALTDSAILDNASKGIFLKSLGEKNFAYVPPSESGLMVEGEVRDAGVVQTNGSKYVIVARNNATLLMFDRHK